MDYYDYGTAYSSSDYSNLGGAILGYSLFAMIIGIAAGVFAIVVMWKLFQKAGKEGWRAIVPFYNTYTLFEITWGNGWLFLLMFLAIIPVVGSIAVLVITIMTMIKLAKAFGKEGGFAVGLIFLSIIFMAILAFDSSTYLGVPGKENVTPNPNPNPNNNQFNGTTEINQNPVPNGPTVENQSASVTAAPVASFCPNCGTQLKAEEAFCPNCGTPKTN